VDEAKRQKLLDCKNQICDGLESLIELLNIVTLDKTEIIIKEKDSCLDCSNWLSVEELCFKFNKRPPANIIVNACASFEPDIPF